MDSQSAFPDAFRSLTGNPPFPWQEELWRRFMANVVEQSLDIPTGLGKTAVMAVWLLARAGGASIPRRLAYIVDRRAVVDQATEVADELGKGVGKHPELGTALKLNGRPLPISTLRGQHVDNKQWLEDPSSPAIIVGTIDMIGSRLLFEGYGVSRKMRPYHAGLLGVDTLVVLDEAHLVPPFEMLLDAISSDRAGVAPRDGEARKIVPPFKFMSLSATGRTRLSRPFSLTDQDFKHPIVRQRLDAKKRLRLKPLTFEGEMSVAQFDTLLADSLAEEAWQISQRGTKAVRVIVFCNKRKVAEEAKKALGKLVKAADQTKSGGHTELFVGGRRVRERQDAADQLKKNGFIAGSKVALTKPVFLLATSAAEVGVDLDADHMVSDLVEWERMIQRLGRVNRCGEGDAQVVVLARPDHPKGKPQPLTSFEARQKPFDLLPRFKDGTINVSPGALRELKQSATPDTGDSADHDAHVRAWRSWILDAATTPEPLRPALTRPLVEAWSMTSLEEHTGRPEVGPWLRGWVDDDPQTAVVWRKYLPIRNQGRVTKKEIETFFEAAPPHTSELLETDTDTVFSWLKKRAEALGKKHEEPIFGPEPMQPIGFVLSPAGDLRGTFFLRTGKLEYLSASKRTRQEEDADKKALWNGTLLVDAQLAGLRDGLLDVSSDESPRTADDGQEWLSPIDGEPVIRFRIRSIDADTADHSATAPQWRTRLRFPTTLSEEGDASGLLVVEKWRSASTTEEDRAVGQCQLLEDHQKLAAAQARELAKAMNLPEQLAKMLSIAARLHDEGKRAVRWQRAFNAPTDGVYAKTERPSNKMIEILDGYRHEFGSLEVAPKDAEFLKLSEDLQDLALHLIAAHHGYARPVIGVSGCEGAPPSKLEARARDVAVRFARLQQHWGPWGLAWWESLLRAADHQASRENNPLDAEHAQEVPK